MNLLCLSRQKSFALVPLLALAACGGPGGPSVVLITVDTLRPDRLSCYGHSRETSPHLDKLAAEGVLFERAYAQCNSTGPAHASLLSGVHVKTHGVLNNSLGYRRDDIPTLAQRFQEAGYSTGAVVSIGHLNRGHSGLGRGFDQFVGVRPRLDTPDGASKNWSRPSHEAVNLAIEFVRRAGSKPYFLWLHVFDPHMPYDPDPAYAERYASDLTGRVADMRRLIHREATPAEVMSEMPEVSPEEVVLFESAWRHEIPIPELIYNGVGWTPGEVEALESLYDGEIAQTDEQIGRLVEALEWAAASPPLIVVTADHGESFGKGGIYFDHRGIFEDSIRIPLIYWWPSMLREGRRVVESVEAIDLVPTVLALAGIGADAGLPGRDLSNVLLEGGVVTARPCFVEHANESALAVIEGRWKLILSRLEGREDVAPLVYRHAPVALFDLDSDPEESVDVGEAHPEIAARLTELALAWLADDLAPTADGDGALSPEMRQQLKALGYID